MPKWAMAQVVMRDFCLSVTATEPLDLAWLQRQKHFEKVKFAPFHNMGGYYEQFGCWQMDISNLNNLHMPALWAIAKYLGDNGWELAAANEFATGVKATDLKAINLTFKRQVLD